MLIYTGSLIEKNYTYTRVVNWQGKLILSLTIFMCCFFEIFCYCLEVFYKKLMFLKISESQRKITVSESFLHYVFLPVCNFIKLDFHHIPVKYCLISKNIYFKEHLQMAASGFSISPQPPTTSTESSFWK